jgi:hypothetical protein
VRSPVQLIALTLVCPLQASVARAAGLGDDIFAQPHEAKLPNPCNARRRIATSSDRPSSKQHFDPGESERDVGKSAHQRSTPDVLSPRRQRKLPLNNCKLVVDGVHIAARLVDLSQR